MKLEEIFKSLVHRYHDDPDLTNKLWEELVKNYSNRGRHYHTLHHLDHVLSQISQCQDMLRDWDAALFALYYHDIVYNVLRKDNEEKSAQLAEKKLTGLNVPQAKIELCKKHILATKFHSLSDDLDTNFFTDADLSILGQDWNTYNLYCRQVRKEYSIYPDLIYKPGRRKVLKHFLQMDKIFKTEPFIARFNKQARLNLDRELESLNRFEFAPKLPLYQ